MNDDNINICTFPNNMIQNRQMMTNMGNIYNGSYSNVFSQMSGLSQMSNNTMDFTTNQYMSQTPNMQSEYTGVTGTNSSTPNRLHEKYCNDHLNVSEL